MGMNSLPMTVTRQRRGCDLNPGPSAPESSTLITRLPSNGKVRQEIMWNGGLIRHIPTTIFRVVGQTDISCWHRLAGFDF